MAMHRARLPQLHGEVLLSDGGIETSLIFDDGVELPELAAFTLLADDDGTALLRRYFDRYVGVAREHGLGIVLESPTWRASPRWAAALGYSAPELDAFNRRALELMAAVRDDATDLPSVVISGCVGPEGDGYAPESTLTADQAEEYHARQIEVFAAGEADLATAITMTYAEEAAGVTRAARSAKLPVAISFTVETDGRLPSGQSLAEAIAQVDEETGGGPDYYMLNCAHPTHFADVLVPGEPWLERIRGLRANASRKSHAELDEATELDAGDPEELGAQYRELGDVLPGLSVLGGCCGTDHRHVGAIATAWLGAA